ncbi:MAG: hypothetical protein O7F16_11235 [Acidobacteria bacterium]|nr:hypothetical protein [Acidobacteriota bacterium]
MAILAALFVHAESASACVSVQPGRYPIVQQNAWMDSLAADRSVDAVHAAQRSIRRHRATVEPRPRTPPAREQVALIETETLSRNEPAPAAQAAPTTRGAVQAVRPMPEGTSRAILQGEFAMLLVQTLHLRAPWGGWSPDKAINSLIGMRPRARPDDRFAPPGGWNNGQPVTESDVVSLLQQLGINVIARNPDRSITVQEAETILAKLAALFRELAPATFTEVPEVRRVPLGNPGRPPLSPSTP